MNIDIVGVWFVMGSGYSEINWNEIAEDDSKPWILGSKNKTLSKILVHRYKLFPLHTAF